MPGSPHLLQLQRLIRPAQVTEEAPCCGYTALTVRQLGHAATGEAEGAMMLQQQQPCLAILQVQSCGRAVPRHGLRCKHHAHAAQFEVWRVRPAPGQAGSQAGAVPSQGSVQQEAMLLHSCSTPTDLAAFLQLLPPSSAPRAAAKPSAAQPSQRRGAEQGKAQEQGLTAPHSGTGPEQATQAARLDFVDHWGQYGRRYEQLLIRVGTQPEDPDPGEQHGLPGWRR